MTYIEFMAQFGPVMLNLGALGAIIYIVVIANPAERDTARKDYLLATKEQRQDYMNSLGQLLQAFQAESKADQEARHLHANQNAVLALQIERLTMHISNITSNRTSAPQS